MSKIKIVISIAIVSLILGASSGEVVRAENKKMFENFAYYYYKEGRIGESIKEYKEILKENPRSHKIHYNLGVLYARQKKYSLAVIEFKKAAGDDSLVMKDALYNLVVIYGKYLGDTDQAYKYYEKFKEIRYNK